jgi:hypothetical protein
MFPDPAQWAVLEPLLPRGKKPGRPPEWTKPSSLMGSGCLIKTISTGVGAHVEWDDPDRELLLGRRRRR